MLLGAYELVRSRGRSWLRSARPRRPRAARRARHAVRPGRHRALLPPPARRPAVRRAGDRVALGGAGGEHDVLLRARGDRDPARLSRAPPPDASSTSPSSRSRSSGAVTAIRGIVWFALACMVFVPVAIGRRLESRSAGRAAARPQRRDRVGARASRSSPSPAHSSCATSSWFEELLAARGGRGRARRARARRPRLRPRSLLRLAALEDPRAPRTHRLRRALRALRPSSSSTGSQDYNCEDGPTGSRSRTATASSSSTRRAARTPPTSSRSPARVRSTATTRSRSSLARRP